MPETEAQLSADELDYVLRILEPVTRQNVALAALRPVLARSRDETARARLCDWARALPSEDVDALFRDRDGQITPEWRLLMAMQQLAGQGVGITGRGIAAVLRDDGAGPRLRPRVYRILALRERGGVEPMGSAPELAAAHGRVVSVRKVLAHGTVPQPREVVESLNREPVNLRGAIAAAHAAFDHERASFDLGLARQDRRAAVATTAGEAALVATSALASGRMFGELRPRDALLAALSILVAGAGSVVAKEKLLPTRLMQRMDAAAQAKGTASVTGAAYDMAMRDFRRHPTRVGDSRPRHR